MRSRTGLAELRPSAHIVFPVRLRDPCPCRISLLSSHRHQAIYLSSMISLTFCLCFLTMMTIACTMILQDLKRVPRTMAQDSQPIQSSLRSCLQPLKPLPLQKRFLLRPSRRPHRQQERRQDLLQDAKALSCERRQIHQGHQIPFSSAPCQPILLSCQDDRKVLRLQHLQEERPNVFPRQHLPRLRQYIACLK